MSGQLAFTGPWMLTSTGRSIELSDPYSHAAAISVHEIAHSLAIINRFTGHTLRPISVAEHSLLVCDIADQVLHLGPLALLAALLHDAHECITSDMTTPTKDMVGDWRPYEHTWEHAFHVAFGLRQVFEAYGPAIRRADLIALATERRDLMHPGGPEWASLRGVEPLAHVNLRDRDAFTWQDWRTAFIDRYEELEFARAALCRSS